MSLTITQISVEGFDKNFSYLLSNTDTGSVFVVDPSGDLEAILETAETQQMTIAGVLITHTHQDHFDKLSELLQSYLVPVYVHESAAGEIISPGAINYLTDGEIITLDNEPITVIHTPGHADSSVCYYIKAKEDAKQIPRLVTGDTLFVQGCGRTSETRVKDLYESLQELKALPEETVIYSGHDYGPTPTSTIGEEKRNNRFLLAKNFNEFRNERLGLNI